MTDGMMAIGTESDKATAHFSVCYNGEEAFFDTIVQCESFCELLMSRTAGSDIWITDGDSGDERLYRTYMYNMLTGKFEIS